MGDEIDPLTAIAVKAIEGVTPEIYKDGLQPMVREVGKGLELVAKAVNACLLPLRGMVWGSEKIAEYLDNAVTKRLANVPPENIQPPDPAIAGPAMEAMRFMGDKEELRSMFASLIAMSMNSATAGMAHPSFVEVIKQLSKDEGLMLEYMSNGHNYFYVSDIFQELSTSLGRGVICLHHVTDFASKAGCTDNKSSPFYLENLLRLQLIEKVPTDHNATEHREFIDLVLKELDSQDAGPRTSPGAISSKYTALHPSIMQVTVFGTRFIGSCVNPGWSGLG